MISWACVEEFQCCCIAESKSFWYGPPKTIGKWANNERVLSGSLQPFTMTSALFNSLYYCKLMLATWYFVSSFTFSGSHDGIEIWNRHESSFFNVKKCAGLFRAPYWWIPPYRFLFYLNQSCTQPFEPYWNILSSFEFYGLFAFLDLWKPFDIMALLGLLLFKPYGPFEPFGPFGPFFV